MDIRTTASARRRYPNDTDRWATQERIYNIRLGRENQSILQNIQGHEEYKHGNGEISIVNVELARMGVRQVRVAGLPPEVKEPVLRDVMSKYGDVKIFRTNNGLYNIDTRYRTESKLWN